MQHLFVSLVLPQLFHCFYDSISEDDTSFFNNCTKNKLSSLQGKFVSATPPLFSVTFYLSFHVIVHKYKYGDAINFPILIK